MAKGREDPRDWVLDAGMTPRCCEALDKSPNRSGLSLFHKGRGVDSGLYLNLLPVTDGFENVVKSTSPSTPRENTPFQEKYMLVHTQRILYGISGVHHRTPKAHTWTI